MNDTRVPAVRSEETLIGVPAVPSTNEDILVEVRGLVDLVARLQSLIVSQGGDIAELRQAMATVRVSRTQELAINEAIRTRARELAASELLPGQERRIAAAIRSTLRATTGARASGDVQASQFDNVIEMISGWYMRGALRRIRKIVEE